jgi:glycosyltransferase involved in cell wall biosynthesis
MVVPAGDAAALAAAIDALMADDEARTRLGAAAHAYAAERFAAASALDAHLALYRRLIAQPRS